jgi:hypothetical protein
MFLRLKKEIGQNSLIEQKKFSNICGDQLMKKKKRKPNEKKKKKKIYS